MFIFKFIDKLQGKILDFALITLAIYFIFKFGFQHI